jgi:hypothetical protein
LPSCIYFKFCLSDDLLLWLGYYLLIYHLLLCQLIVIDVNYKKLDYNIRLILPCYITYITLMTTISQDISIEKITIKSRKSNQFPINQFQSINQSINFQFQSISVKAINFQRDYLPNPTPFPRPKPHPHDPPPPFDDLFSTIYLRRYIFDIYFRRIVFRLFDRTPLSMPICL